MAGDNSEQIKDWNGPSGERWAAEQEKFDVLTAPFGQAAMKAANVRSGEQVIDVGCGCGGSSIELARLVGASGSVLGVDVSQPMLEVARRRAKAAGLANLGFEQADASNARLPAEQDLLYSRFGVMFFADPELAFAHMRRSLAGGGRLAFVCWRSPKENPWAMVPVMAARKALGIDQPSPDPHAPGPFAFADDNRVRAILQGANFKDVVAEPFDAGMPGGRNAREAAEESVRLGPVARLAHEAGPDALPRILEAVEKALAPMAAADGSITLPGRAWIVTAKAG
jgi:SAM-dependent methyltransferase